MPLFLIVLAIVLVLVGAGLVWLLAAVAKVLWWVGLVLLAAVAINALWVLGILAQCFIEAWREQARAE